MIQIGTLCFTCGSRIPANNNRLVVVTAIDPLRQPDCYRIRQVSGDRFYATTRPNGVRNWQQDSEAWTARSRLRPIDPERLGLGEQQGAHDPVHA